MVVVVKRENTEDVVVLMGGLAEVAAVLLVPIVAVGVTRCAVLAGRVDVSAVLASLASRGVKAFREHGGPCWGRRARLVPLR